MVQWQLLTLIWQVETEGPMVMEPPKVLKPLKVVELPKVVVRGIH
jgi:hypothetical protein